jgi:hypothetical protein
MNQEMYDTINRELAVLASDLDLPSAVIERVYMQAEDKRIYIGSGEDFCSFKWNGDEVQSTLVRCEERA